MTHYALSLKQPWAALLAYGLKTIEVRRWPTKRRGRVLIHAATVPDERPEAWELVPPAVRAAAERVGGVIGSADLQDCLTYAAPEPFAADQRRHLNQPGWFRPPVMYGFLFANPRVLQFRPHPGQVRFFRVPDADPDGERRTGLLVSVRSGAEAAAALAGGAAIIDVKEPAHGPLGRAGDDTIAEVVRVVGGRRPVSAALGEVRRESRPPAVSGLAYLKWGLADCGGADWKALLTAAERDAVRAAPGVRVVTAAYADWQLAGAPPIDDVVAFALERPGGVLLLDTYHKRGPEPDAPPPTLLDCLPAQKISLYCRLCRRCGVHIALAGSLRAEQIVQVLPLGPDWIAVRGAACRDGRRGAPVEEAQVRRLVDLLSRPVSPATSAG